jgi:hypothetical protein
VNDAVFVTEQAAANSGSNNSLNGRGLSAILLSALAILRRIKIMLLILDYINELPLKGALNTFQRYFIE